MITSKKGKEMILSVSPIYEQNRVMLAIFQTIGIETEMSEELVNDVSKQLFVQTATWGLDYWETAVGLLVNKGDTFENRRVKILAKMQTRYPVTPNRVKKIIETVTGQNVDIMQNISPYTFAIIFKNADTINMNFIDILNEIKPAHLSYNLRSEHNTTLELITDSKEYKVYYPICGTYLCGTYPNIAVEGSCTRTSLGIDIKDVNAIHHYPLTGVAITKE